MDRRLRVLLASGLILLALLAGCAKQPTGEIEAAKAAVSGVMAEGAGEYATEEAKALEGSLNAAMEEVKAQDPKLVKNYAKAKEMLAKVVTDAGALKAAIAIRKEEARKARTAQEEEAKKAEETKKARKPEEAKKAKKAQKSEEAKEKPSAKKAVKEEAKKVEDLRAVIETKFGSIELKFFPDVAPGHVKSFIDLAKKGFYDGTTFHRVIPGFMIQGGDPKSKDASNRGAHGTGGPGYTVKAEFSSKPHKRGTLSMARSSDPDSAGSQFFICVADAPFLDGKYTVFGEVVGGLDAVDKIVSEPRDPRDNPLERVEMKVRVK